jgi:prepilin signal peptidase PulO-like enzyme (type II secretory pathway)
MNDKIDEKELVLKRNLPFIRFFYDKEKEKNKSILNSVLFELLFIVVIVLSIFLQPKGVDPYVDYVSFVIWVIILAQLFALMLINIKSQLYPDRLIFPLMLMAVIYNVFTGNNVIDVLLGGLILGGVPWVVYVMSKGSWIGFGDVKFGLAAGLLLGWQLAILCLLLFVALFALIVIYIYAMKTFANRDTMSRLPTGALWVVSIIICELVGQRFIDLFI